MFTYTYPVPFGLLTITENSNAIIDISFHRPTELATLAVEKETPLIKHAYQQLQEYFSGIRKQFDLPLAPEGTAFQKKVWAALQAIPYGKTASYQDIAIKVGCPKGPRAIGLANNKNPIAIVIPCHRVIGKNGKMVGYGGGLPIKEFLLDLEAKTSLK